MLEIRTILNTYIAYTPIKISLNENKEQLGGIEIQKNTRGNNPEGLCG